MKMMLTATVLLHDFRTMSWTPCDRRQPAESDGHFCFARTDTKIRCGDGDSEWRRQGGLQTLAATGSGGYRDGKGGGLWRQRGAAATGSGCDRDLGGELFFHRPFVMARAHSMLGPATHSSAVHQSYAGRRQTHNGRVQTWRTQRNYHCGRPAAGPGPAPPTARRSGTAAGHRSSSRCHRDSDSDRVPAA
jgi:hypothetical protein